LEATTPNHDDITWKIHVAMSLVFIKHGSQDSIMAVSHEKSMARHCSSSSTSGATTPSYIEVPHRKSMTRCFLFDTRKMYDTPRDRTVSQLSHSHRGMVKRKERCAGVPVYHDTQKKNKEREKYFINHIDNKYNSQALCGLLARPA
jgi:hypothetical protein